jgi:hypothetical protein
MLAEKAAAAAKYSIALKYKVAFCKFNLWVISENALASERC